MTTADDLARVWLRRLTRSQLFGSPPPRIGRYEVTGHLGTGGMGVVLRGVDTRLGRSVALKLIAPSEENGGPSVLAEAGALARFAHPNVVGVFEVVSGGHTPYLVMELVEGTRIDEWSRRVGSPERATQAVLEAGEALAFAHEHGVVHGDFKPANVLVREDELVKLVDFGLAQQTSTTHPTSPYAGTPGYAAPEQSRLGPSALADQYAFCAAFIDVLARVTSSSRGVLSDEARRSLASAVLDRRTRRALLRGLSSSPAARFGSMSELLTNLRRGSRGGRALRWTSVMLCVVGVGAAVSFGSAAPSCEQDAQAFAERWHGELRPGLLGATDPDTGKRGIELLSAYAEQLVQESAESCRTTGSSASRACLGPLQREFESTVEVLSSNSRAMARSVDVVAGLKDVADCNSVAGRHQPKHAPRLRRLLARVRTLALARRHQEAEKLARKTILIATREGDELAAGRATRWLGAALRDRRPSEAAVQFERAYFLSVRGRDERLSAVCALGLAGVLVGDLDELSRGRRWNEQAKAHLERLDEPSATLRALTIHVEASILETQADYEAALQLSARATSMLGSKTSESTIEVRFTYGRLLAESGQLEEAHQVYIELHERLVARYGRRSQAALVAQAILGSLDDDLGESELGRQRVDDAIAALELDDDPPYAFLIPIYANRAGMHFDAGEWGAAIRAGHRALDALERSTLRDADGITGLILINLSQAYNRAGHPAKGVEYGLKSCALLLAERGAEHPHYAHALMAVGKAAVEAGDLAVAQDYSTRARETFEKGLGAGHPLAAYAVSTLSQIATAEGRHKDSLRLARSAFEMLAAGSTANQRAAITLLYNVSERLRALSRFEEAMETSGEVLERARSFPGAPPALVGLGHLSVAESQLGVGAYSDAVTSATSAIDSLTGEASSTLEFAEARFALARSLFDGGTDPTMGIGIARSIADGERTGADPELRAEAASWLQQRRH